MQSSTNRSVVVIAALGAVIVLGVASFGLALRNGWLRTASPAPHSGAADVLAESPGPGRPVTPVPVAVSAPAAAAVPAPPEEAAAYRRKLEEAYRALDEAYAQIKVLQAPQRQPRSRRDDDDDRSRQSDDDDAHRERRSRAHDTDER